MTIWQWNPESLIEMQNMVNTQITLITVMQL
jgi:hypothetical protein